MDKINRIATIKNRRKIMILNPKENKYEYLDEESR